MTSYKFITIQLHLVLSFLLPFSLLMLISFISISWGEGLPTTSLVNKRWFRKYSSLTRSLSHAAATFLFVLIPLFSYFSFLPLLSYFFNYFLSFVPFHITDLCKLFLKKWCHLRNRLTAFGQWENENSSSKLLFWLFLC